MKDIKGYEGLYAITSCGKVWSYRRQKFLKTQVNRCGYEYVILQSNNKQKTVTVHRLVAEAYIPNPENKPQVNHKDENKQNNCVNNLEWMTAKENMNYGTRTQRTRKKVYCVELDRVFDGVRVAARELGIAHNHISYCCNGKQKSAKGYHFRYADEVAE